jgi:hypothetical protein
VSWLRKALAARAGGMVYLKSDPAFVSLRSDTDFQTISIK